MKDQKSWATALMRWVYQEKESNSMIKASLVVVEYSQHHWITL